MFLTWNVVVLSVLRMTEHVVSVRRADYAEEYIEQDEGRGGNISEVPKEDILRKTLEVLAPTSGHDNDICREHAQLFQDGVERSELWALQMLDASVKPPDTWSLGENTVLLGNYNKCVSIRGLNRTGQEVFGGQYCLVTSGRKTILPQKVEPVTWSLCAPWSCESVDIQVHLSHVLADKSVRVKDCTTNLRHRTIDAGDIAMTVVFGVFTFVIIGSTIYDYIQNKKKLPDEENRWRTWFSLPRNLNDLLSAMLPGYTMSSVHGLRFLTAMWVLLLARYRVDVRLPAVINRDDIFDQLRDDWTVRPITSARDLAADTFFLLSGMFTCYVFFKDRAVDEKFRKLTLLKFYLYRYVRISCVYAVCIGVSTTLMYQLGSGAMWSSVAGKARERCKIGWWTNLVYVNNFVYSTPSQQCLPQSWWLAADMQLFLLSPLILYPLWKWPRYGRIQLSALLLVSVVVPFWYTYTAAIYEAEKARLEPTDEIFFSDEMAFYLRTTPYLMGICLGYVLHCTKCPSNLTIMLPQPLVLLGWIISTCSSLIIVYLNQMFPRREYPLGASFYASFRTSGWAVSIAWIIFACERGYGGYAKIIMSWRGFQPLGKLSYCMFLVEDLLFLYQRGSVRAPQYFTHFTEIERTLGDALILLCISTVFYLSFELPFINLCRCFLKPEGRRSSAGNLTGGSQLSLARHIQFLSNTNFSLKKPDKTHATIKPSEAN